MINLLSKKARSQLRAARLNITLRRYVAIFVLILVLVLASFVIGYYLLMLEANAAKVNSERYASERAQYTETITEANAYRKDLEIAKEILANEIQLSDLAIGITKALPRDVILSNLSLSTATLDQSLVLQISMRSYQDAVNAKDQLEASSIFEDVSIVSTRVTPPEEREGLSTEYPVITSMSMRLSAQEETSR